MRYATIFAVAWVLLPAYAANFPFETNTLTEDEISSLDFSAVKFTSTEGLLKSNTACKVFPGDSKWPMTEEWARLNETLSGALLRPEPLAAACYPDHPLFNATKCNFLLTTRERTFIDDALSLANGWPQGNTCLLTRNPTGNCTHGGYPEYVVNATTVRQIQIAVNFARNRNIRLIIK